MWVASILAVFAICHLPLVEANVFLHFPRGSNNRLDVPSRDGNSSRRLFDSQSNVRGGYNVMGTGTDSAEYFYEGSVMHVQWTVAHSCGHPNAQCDVILQYMCDDGVRNGHTWQTIPDNNVDGDDTMYGRHESYEWYQACKARRRNKGLFAADQNVTESATSTRQNPESNRYGFECAEERDYYPYWHPTPWKDIAVLTSNAARCAGFRNASQNVAARAYCDVDLTWQTDLLANGATPT